jgi:ribulose-phosphate 3-epimerase
MPPKLIGLPGSFGPLSINGGKPMIKIAPSILSADFSRLGEEIKNIEQGGADYIHFDVMDGLFVPNISIGIPVLESVRKITQLELDVHLMIERPVRYLEAFSKAGADIINIHIEADSEDETLRALSIIRKLGKRPAITLKPGTPAVDAEPYIRLVDLVLVMTVEPGFGGQIFMPDMLPKIREMRKLIDSKNPGCELQVDGGINPETAPLCIEAGANVLVAGSDIFKSEDRKKRIALLRGIN